MLRYQRDAGSHGLLVGVNYGYSTVKGGNYTNDGGQPGVSCGPPMTRPRALKCSRWTDGNSRPIGRWFTARSSPRPIAT